MTSGGSRGGATGGHGPPQTVFKKNFFLHHLKMLKNFFRVTLVFKVLRLLDYTCRVEIGPENSVNYPPSNSRNPSTTPPPLEIGPENSVNYPPLSNSRNPSSTTPPRNRAGKLRQLPPPPSNLRPERKFAPPPKFNS